MMRSGNAEEFDAALGRWSYPPANVVFGDASGDIGYHMTGASPIRTTNPNTSGNAFQDGSGLIGLWQGFIPHELQPHVLSPMQGWLASANHRSVESWYPMHQTGSGSSGHTIRSWRLYELMQTFTHVITPDDVLTIHYDDVDPAKRTIVEAAVYLVDEQGANLAAEATRALDLLRPWLVRGAHCNSSDTAYPLVYHISTSFRMRSSSLASLARYGGGESGLVLFCKALRESMAVDAIIDSDAKAYIENAIVQSWNVCLAEYGRDPTVWLERFRNRLAERELEYMVGLDGFPSLNPRLGIEYPILSDLTTSTILSQGGQSYTQFVSLDDVDSAMSLMPVGNSEVPQSPFYNVNLDAWAEGELHPAPLSKKVVDVYQVDTELLRRTQ